jgi:branched-chain amino acid transport system ATP-binding protein
MFFLEVRKLSKHFGGLVAVHEFDINVSGGEIVGLIGPNGAGKSTLLNMIDRSLRSTRGEIFFNGEDVSKLPSYLRARRGIARVFQQNVLFNNFTVLQNVKVGNHLQLRISPSSILRKTNSYYEQKTTANENAQKTLDFVGLSQYADELATNLPHGMQRRLGLAIALATKPQLLLLDEPLTGMNAEEVETMLAMIRTIRKSQGITCLIVEHNLKAVMDLCDRIAVLNFGIKIAEGTPQKIVKNQTVVDAYLGIEDNVA